jgi:hypothetical protein
MSARNMPLAYGTNPLAYTKRFDNKPSLGVVLADVVCRAMHDVEEAASTIYWL